MKTLKTCPCCKSVYPLPDRELEDTVCDECGVSHSIDSKFQEHQMRIFEKIIPSLFVKGSLESSSRDFAENFSEGFQRELRKNN